MDGLCGDSIALVSRLPNTYALTNTAKIAAAQRAQWKTVGAIARRQGAAEYKIWETQGSIADHSLRLIVVQSSALAAKADRSVPHDQAKAADELDRAAQRLNRRRFTCPTDAQTAWED